MLTENTLIARYIAPIAQDINDDAALLSVPEGYELVVTTDTLISNVHFYADDPAALIAKKALRVSLSDLAAKGAKPYVFTLNIALPSPFNEDFVREFFKGLAKDMKAFDILLIGGDTTSAPVLMLTITAFGLVPKGKAVRRNGAKAGDILAVTGTIGDSALGLTQKQGYYRDRYLLPQPRVSIYEFVQKYATASMDISDGMVGDAQKLCAASKVGATIHVESVPLYQPLNEENLVTALTGGDDYELLLTIPTDKFIEFKRDCALKNVQLTAIGTVNASQELKILHHNSLLLFENKSFEHR